MANTSARLSGGYDEACDRGHCRDIIASMLHLIGQIFTGPWPYVIALSVIGLAIGHRAIRAAVVLWLLAGLMLAQNCAWTFAWLGNPLVAESNQLSLNTGCLDGFPVVVVLGGGLASKDKLAPASRERVDRAAEFLSEKPKAVVLSGGPTLGGEFPLTEAALSERDLRRALGPETSAGLRFFREERSLSTYQNARRTLELVDQQALGHKVILITSVYHMPRAAAVFSAQGFEVCALPAYPSSLELPDFVSYANAAPIAALVHEHLGRWYYKWRRWSL